MCVTFATCEVRVCGLRCRSGSSLYIYRVYYRTIGRRRDFSLAVYGKPGRMLLLLHVALSAFIDPRSPEPLASELRELSSGASPDAPERAPLTPQLELNDAPIMELHSTRVQGSTCKHAAIPTGLSRRCDWVVMNETSAGLIKYRSPPRCVSSPKFPRNFATPCPTHQRARTVFVSMCMGQAATTFVAQWLLPRLDEPVVLFTMSRDITLPLQRTCGGDPVDGHCKYDDYTVEQ